MYLAFPIHPALATKGLPLITTFTADGCFFLVGHIKLEKELFNKFFH